MSENRSVNGPGRELTQFKPGEISNPNGRPKGSKDSLKAKVRRLLRTRAPSEVEKILKNYGYEPDSPTYADAVAIVAVHQAMQGEVPAIKLLKEMDEDNNTPIPQDGKVVVNVIAVAGKETPRAKVMVNGVMVND